MKKDIQYGKNVLGKVVAVCATVGAIASNSMAAVTYSEATGFAGTFDLAPYYSAIGMVVGAIAVVASIGLALKTFRKVG